MKKLPVVFILFLWSCSAPKQIVADHSVLDKHEPPYYIFAVGAWNSDYSILTLTDNHNSYFTIKTSYNSSLKRGDVYKP
jgi:hypothetical protein